MKTLLGQITQFLTMNALGYPVYVDHVLDVPMATLEKILGELMV